MALAHCPVALARSTDLAPPIPAPKQPWLLRLLDRYLAIQSLHRQHQALLRLDDALLRDIGITRSMAVSLASQPVWDAPNYWKR